MVSLNITQLYYIVFVIFFKIFFFANLRETFRTPNKSYPLMSDFIDSCRRLKFLQQKDGYGLVGHVIQNISLPIGMHISSHCRNWCTMEDRCRSINMGPSGEKDKFLCQLSESDHLQHPNDLKPMTGFMYRGTEVRVLLSLFFVFCFLSLLLFVSLVYRLIVSSLLCEPSATQIGQFYFKTF